MLTLIVAVTALVTAGIGQVQNHRLRHWVIALQVTHVKITEQQRQQADTDLEALLRIVANDERERRRSERDTTTVLALDVDAEVTHVIAEAERIVRDESGGEA